MQALSIQEKIESLIRQLEDEVRKITSSHQTELDKIREDNSFDLDRMKHQFEQQIASAAGHYQSRIVHLEGEISYLKELILSQRLMMEDNLEYIKALEMKLNTAPSLG